MPTNPFRDAYLWHLKETGAQPAKIAREMNVSPDILKKLKSIPTYKTNPEAANKITAYFGKDYDSFIACGPVGEDAEFVRLASRLSGPNKRLARMMLQDMLRLQDEPEEPGE